MYNYRKIIFALNLTIILNLVIHNHAVIADLRERWDNDIFCGRQFDDLITQTNVASSRVIIPVVLVMYTPDCEALLRTHDLHEQRIPPRHYLVIAKYDYVTSPRHIWYKLDERDDLVQRYNPRRCLEYLYFEKGTMHDTDAPQRYVGDKFKDDILAWIWDKMRVTLRISNTRQDSVIVKIQGRGPQLSSVYIRPGKEVLLDVYMSYILEVIDVETWQFLHGVEVTEESKGRDLVLTPDMDPEDNNQWFDRTLQEQNKQEEDLKVWHWNLAVTYLHDFKQPVLLPKFTETGYKLGVIPPDLYETLLGFYRSNLRRLRRNEHRAERALPIINYDYVDTSMVHLTESLKSVTAAAMQALMEEWVGLPLVTTAMYGIREYYRGNVLRNHVDRITTHVVSVILQIDQDLGGNPDWELEIIGFDGIRRNITLHPGEMLFYESATLIHGRPFPFKGNIFANAFLHYKPVNGWHWAMSENLQKITYKWEVVEDVEKFATDNTRLKPINRKRFVEEEDNLHKEL